jgi:hypothetical protein
MQSGIKRNIREGDGGGERVEARVGRRGWRVDCSCERGVGRVEDGVMVDVVGGRPLLAAAPQTYVQKQAIKGRGPRAHKGLDRAGGLLFGGALGELEAHLSCVGGMEGDDDAAQQQPPHHGDETGPPESPT